MLRRSALPRCLGFGGGRADERMNGGPSADVALGLLNSPPKQLIDSRELPSEVIEWSSAAARVFSELYARTCPAETLLPAIDDQCAAAKWRRFSPERIVRSEASEEALGTLHG
jgi:hypothetical protein